MTWQESVAKTGYAILPSMFSEREIGRLSSDLASAKLQRSRAGVRHAFEHPAVKKLAHDERLVGLARAILGPHAAPFHATLFDKSPDANWLVMWHQDTALPLRERREVAGWGPWSVKEGTTYAHAPAEALSNVLALRVHLDSSEASNGPLRVLPGTHLLGVIDDQSIQKLAQEVTPVECLADQGGVLAMRPLLVHASSKTTGPKSRRVLHIQYAASYLLSDGLELPH
jgi:ectoine hydroxylase-related dioxygenase (phytanoyl-CoA dioxygenase family)